MARAAPSAWRVCLTDARSVDVKAVGQSPRGPPKQFPSMEECRQVAKTGSKRRSSMAGRPGHARDYGGNPQRRGDQRVARHAQDPSRQCLSPEQCNSRAPARIAGQGNSKVPFLSHGDQRVRERSSPTSCCLHLQLGELVDRPNRPTSLGYRRSAPTVSAVGVNRKDRVIWPAGREAKAKGFANLSTTLQDFKASGTGKAPTTRSSSELATKMTSRKTIVRQGALRAPDPGLGRVPQEGDVRGASHAQKVGAQFAMRRRVRVLQRDAQEGLLERAKKYETRDCDSGRSG